MDWLSRTRPVAENEKQEFAGALPPAAADPFRSLIEHTPDLIWIVDDKSRINFISPAVTEHLGWAPGTLIGARGDLLIPPEELDLYTATMHSLARVPGSSTSLEIQVLRSDSSRCWVTGNVTNLSHYPSLNGTVVSVRDIDQRHAYENGLIRRSFFDELTGLPTRALFIDRLEQAIKLAANDLIIKVLYIDIDNFGAINEQLGFGPADELLRETAARLKKHLPSSAIIGRFLNDEFLVAQVSAESNRGELVKAVTRTFSEAFQLGDRTVRASASIGLTTTTSADISAKELIDQAGTAAYEAKTHGQGQAVTYTEPLNKRSVFRRETESQLMKAVDNGELRLHYQPVIDVNTKLAVGVEALVRWEHPNRGLIPPSEFITIAEETGLIVNIGYWVIDQTTSLVSELNQSWRGRPLFGSVNLSPRQLSDHALLQRVHMAITRSGLSSQLLHLDVTEASLQGAQTRIGHQLQRLSQMGIELAIDDFGTGSSSLAMVRETPATYLKIDRSFTSQLTLGGVDIVTGIIAVAHSLGLIPIAEGVETEHQLSILKDLGCPFSQGYLHARPLPKSDLIAFLADNYLQVI